VLIQGPPRKQGEEDEGHDPDEDKRVRGCVDVPPTALEWEATVDIDPAEFRPGEARGVAMAVMEKPASMPTRR
jgi:hypothetical protein